MNSQKVPAVPHQFIDTYDVQKKLTRAAVHNYLMATQGCLTDQQETILNTKQWCVNHVLEEEELRSLLQTPYEIIRAWMFCFAPFRTEVKLVPGANNIVHVFGVWRTDAEGAAVFVHNSIDSVIAASSFTYLTRIMNHVLRGMLLERLKWYNKKCG